MSDVRPPLDIAALSVAAGPARGSKPSVEQILQQQGFAFDFFQAVRVLERIQPRRRPVGRYALPMQEVVRFRSHPSLAFPASSIHQFEAAAASSTLGGVEPPPSLTVAFMGLIGPQGVLPRHYTELVMRLARDQRGAERYALRDFLDLFNHRWISLFYRAWEKYRFFIPYERGDAERVAADPYTQALMSLIGMGPAPLRDRLVVTAAPTSPGGRKTTLARIDDLALLYYGGLLSQRPANVVNLQAIVADFFQVPVEVRQFQGQWLRLDPRSQSRLSSDVLAGVRDGNNRLGVSMVAGERIWDVQGKFRVRLGPLAYHQFDHFLPDRAADKSRKAFFLLTHLVRLYAGIEFDFDIQLVLQKEDIPSFALSPDPARGPRLGWNTWLTSQPPDRDADDALFSGEELFEVSAAKTP